MKLQKPTLILLALVAATAGAIWYVVYDRTAQETDIEGMGTLVFEGEDFNDLNRVTLTGSDLQSTLEKRDGSWVVVEMGDYPANQNRVAGLLAGLKTAQRVEPKTEDQNLFQRMRLGPDATVLSADLPDGRTLTLVTGDQYYSARGDGVMTFAFDPSWGRAWTLAGLPEIHEDPIFWLNTNLLDISPARVKSLTVTITGQTPWQITRADPAQEGFVFQGVAANLLDLNRVNAAASGMISLDFEAMELSGTQGLIKVAEARIETFDGLQVQMVFYDKDQIILAELRAIYNEAALNYPGAPTVLPDAPLDGQKEVQDMNALWQGNLYQIPLGQLATFLKFRNEFLKNFNQAN